MRRRRRANASHKPRPGGAKSKSAATLHGLTEVGSAVCSTAPLSRGASNTYAHNIGQRVLRREEVRYGGWTTSCTTRTCIVQAIEAPSPAPLLDIGN